MPQAILIPMLINLAIAIAMMALKMILAPKPSASPQAPDPGARITSRQPLAPHRVVYGQTRVGGTIAYLKTSETNRYLHAVIVVAAHEVEEIGDTYFNEEGVPIDAGTGEASGTGGYVGYMRVKKKLGATGQTAFSDLVALADSGWTTAHKLTGHAAVYVRLKWSVDHYPQGIPNMTFVLKGRKVYDPRTGLTVWSHNAALCVADFLCSTEFGLGAVYADEIDEAALIAAANICDETVSTSRGNTNRYTCNGSFTTDKAPVDTLADLVGAMAGHVKFIGGRWIIVAGAWEAPAISFDEDDLEGAINISTLMSRRDNFNAVRGTFISPVNQWQPTDFPAITSSTYEAQDGGERVFNDVTLPFTDDAAMAQRIARIHLRRVRQPITITWPGRLSCYAAIPGDVVSITIARYGWSAKAFEVQDAKLVWREPPEGDGPGSIGVDLTLRETASSIYDWNLSEEIEVDGAPNTSLPDVFNVIPPTNLAVVEELYDTRSASGVKARATMTWSGSADAFSAGYRPRYRLVGATDWTSATWNEGTVAVIPDIAPGLYEFAVAAFNIRGVASPYIVAVRTITGLGAVPTNPANLTFNATGDVALLRWDQSPDLDVKIGGLVAVRWTAETASPTWAGGLTVAASLPGWTDSAIVALRAGTYMIKFRDSSGLWSSSPATAPSYQSSVHEFTALASTTQDPGWAGAKTNAGVDSGLIYLVGDEMMDDWPDVDSVESWDWSGGVAATGTYEFDAYMDLGAVTRCRLTAATVSSIVSILDLMDSWADVDARLDFDGAVVGDEADARVYVAATNDNPAGAPTWGAWQRLDAATFEARGFKFKIEMTSADPAFTIQFSEARVYAEEVV